MAAIRSRYYVIVLVCSVLNASPSVAGGSAQHSGRALQHSVNAVGYSAVASAQFVSAVAAIPLGFGGTLGAISQDMSDELWEAANSPVGAPLPITDDVVTVGPPPSEAMSRKQGVAP